MSGGGQCLVQFAVHLDEAGKRPQRVGLPVPASGLDGVTTGGGGSGEVAARRVADVGGGEQPGGHLQLLLDLGDERLEV
ncbi:hypothetical protein DEQ16_12050, partial [Dietzia maris]